MNLCYKIKKSYKLYSLYVYRINKYSLIYKETPILYYVLLTDFRGITFQVG